MKLPKLRIDEVKDDAAKENFQKLDAFLKDHPLTKNNWQIVEITFTTATANYSYPHQLGFQPLDVIQTSAIGAGVVEWHNDDFTSSHVYLSTTDAVTVRALIGRLG